MAVISTDAPVLARMRSLLRRVSARRGLIGPIVIGTLAGSAGVEAFQIAKRYGTAMRHA